jgi:V/A-type H+-transporting ATPase subunit E
MSDHSLDTFIAKVKSEAIDKAEKEAARILQDAKDKAQLLLDNANAEKDEILAHAKTEAKAIQHKGTIALQQAARDLHIAIKNDLLKLFESVLETKIKKSFTKDKEFYTSIIDKVLDSMGSSVQISLPEDLQDKLVAAIRKKVTKSDKTVHIIQDKKLLSGLSITKTDEGWSYDITAEDIAALLSQHLSQKWIDTLKEE